MEEYFVFRHYGTEESDDIPNSQLLEEQVNRRMGYRKGRW